MDRISARDGLEIFQFSGELIDANSFVIIEKKEAFIIDAVDSSDMVSFITERKLKELRIFLTHEHFDHIGGLNRLRNEFVCHVTSTDSCSDRIQSPQKNFSSFGDVLLAMHNKTEQRELVPRYMAAPSDEMFSEDYSITWNGHQITCHPMHGHSPGSAGYILDGTILFSGDELLPIPTVTRFPGGSTRAFWDEDIPWLESIKKSITMVCPGHGMAGDLDTMINGNVSPARFRHAGEDAHAQTGDL